jgi:diaminopimelate decarboxylase
MNLKKLDNFKGINLLDIANEYGTPVYVYNLDKVKENYQKLFNSIPYENKKILFAMKSNFNVDILKTLRYLKCGIDAVSTEEIAYALDLGFKSEDILFTGIGISNEDIKYCISRGIVPNVGSIDLLERISKNYPGINISIRINPDFGHGHHDHVITGGPHSKFGIYESYLEEVKRITEKYKVNVIGVHFHIGSGILNFEPYIRGIKKALDISRIFKTIEFVDIGGGIGIPYRENDNNFDLEKFGESISKLMDEFSKAEGRNVKLLLEPGRFLVAESGVLLAKVVEIKHTPLYKFAIVNTGFNHLARPVMYGSYHEIINISKIDSKEFEEIVVAGNLCESGDIFTRNEESIEPRRIQKVEYGDILGIFDAGAYGYSMASHYNLKKFPKEIVVKDGYHRLSEKAYLKYVL